MNPRPLVSVIVPMHNAAPWLKRCLDSLHAQAIEEIEFILVNDASTDETTALVQAAAAHCPQRFRHLSLSPRQGIGAARNAGLALARGVYVGFVDADDTAEPQMFQTLCATARKHNADMVICGMQVLFNHGTETVLPSSTDDAYDVLSQSRLVSPPWNKLYSREFLQKNTIDFPLSSMSEDMAFAFKVLAHSPRLASVPEALYNYHKHGAGVTLDIQRRKDALISLADVRQHLKTHHLWTQHKTAYRRLYWLHLVYYPLCLVLIDALWKGRNRWHNLRYAPAYFFQLLRFWLRG